MVSDAAVACPDCARPIAALHAESRTANERRPRAARPAAVTPIAARPPIVRAVTERAPSGKRCSKCNADVGEDFFRVKEAPGVYLCADCDDARERIHLERQSARKRLAARGGILLAVFIIVMGLVVGASEFMSAKRQSRLTIDK